MYVQSASINDFLFVACAQENLLGLAKETLANCWSMFVPDHIFVIISEFVIPSQFFFSQNLLNFVGIFFLLQVVEWSQENSVSRTVEKMTFEGTTWRDRQKKIFKTYRSDHETRRRNLEI